MSCVSWQNLVGLIRLVLPADAEIKSSLPLRTDYFQETRSDRQAASRSPATQTAGNNSVLAKGVIEEFVQLALWRSVKVFVANQVAEAIKCGYTFRTEENAGLSASGCSGFGDFMLGPNNIIETCPLAFFVEILLMLDHSLVGHALIQ